jgi:hypothetical protein
MSNELNLATAQWLTDQIMALNQLLSVIADKVEKIDCLEQKRDLRGSLADAMILVNMEILRPVVRKFPELDPDT